MQSELAASGLRGFHLAMQLVAAPRGKGEQKDACPRSAFVPAPLHRHGDREHAGCMRVLARTQRERARERGNRFESEVGAQATNHKCNVVWWAGGGAQSLDLYVFARIWMHGWMDMRTGRIYASMHTCMDVDA